MNVKKNNIKIIDKRVNNINYYDDVLDKFDIDVTSFLQKKNDIKNRILQATGFISKQKFQSISAVRSPVREFADCKIEKVYFEAIDGLLVTGNLYIPKNTTLDMPAILSPHGHFREGRFENNKIGSIPARCYNLARQGYVVFSYDMIGYNDNAVQWDTSKTKTIQSCHDLDGLDRDNIAQLWGVSSMSLQLVSGVRSLDFLSNLSFVDSSRIGVTGASGGATQTFMLSAIDERVTVAAPVVMISLQHQGGCACENAPLLRINMNNVEIASTIAPRPLILVSCTGDWTVDTPNKEYPILKKLYSQLGFEDRVTHIQIDADHNYNELSRRAVYRWFNKWLTPEYRDDDIIECALEDLPNKNELSIFTTENKPPFFIQPQKFKDNLINIFSSEIEKIKPTDDITFKYFKNNWSKNFKDILVRSLPKKENISSYIQDVETNQSTISENVIISDKENGSAISATIYSSVNSQPKTVIMLPNSEHDSRINIETLISQKIVDLTTTVIVVFDPFGTDNHKILTPEEIIEHESKWGISVTGTRSDLEKTLENYLTTYNETESACQIRDIITIATFISDKYKGISLKLIGNGIAGLWSLLAGSLIEFETVVADVNEINIMNDLGSTYPLFIPLFKKFGSFKTTSVLLPPTKLLLHNVREQFDADWFEMSYKLARCSSNLTIMEEKIQIDKIISFLK